MESLSPPGLSRHTRRSLLVSLAGAALATKARAWKSENDAENVRRFMTPECEIKMSVEYFANAAADSFRFRDSLTNRAFCLSPNGEENRACQARFAGSLAIAHYHFRSRSHAQMPINLRERVLTIDHDGRMDPRPPFEKLTAIQRGTVSDIKAAAVRQLTDAGPTGISMRAIARELDMTASAVRGSSAWCSPTTRNATISARAR